MGTEEVGRGWKNQRGALEAISRSRDTCSSAARGRLAYLPESGRNGERRADTSVVGRGRQYRAEANLRLREQAHREAAHRFCASPLSAV